MASNSDNVIKVEGGEDKNPKKRRMSAVANDGDDDSNEKKKKNESSTGDSNTNSDLIRPDTVGSKSSTTASAASASATATAAAAAATIKRRADKKWNNNYEEILKYYDKGTNSVQYPKAAVPSRKKLIVAREEYKRKISNLWQWLSLQRRSVKLSQEQKDKLELIKYKTVSFSRTTLPILSSYFCAHCIIPDPSQQKEFYSVDAADDDDDDSNEKKKNESSTDNGNNSNNLMNRPYTVRSKSSTATAHTPTAAETIPPAITQRSQQEESDAELPTSIELSKALCKIVDTDHYSRDESLCALKKLSTWAYTEDSLDQDEDDDVEVVYEVPFANFNNNNNNNNRKQSKDNRGKFLKDFAMYGGIVKVLDFLTVILEEHELAIGTNSMECIEFAVSTVGNVCYDRKDGINSDICLDIATTAVKYDKLGTLLRVNNECNDFENNTSHLEAVKDIWMLFGNIIACNGIMDLVEKKQTMHLFDSGMDIIKKLKFINGRHTIAITTNIGGLVFDALNNIFRRTSYVSYQEFEDRNFLSHCLNVFKKDDNTWIYGSEELIERAINCIDTCHSKDLSMGIKVYESIIPLCVFCLKEFPTNDEIRANVRRILTGACSWTENYRTIEKTGVLEDIVPLLTSDMIDDDEKTEWRNIATMITAP